jgi:hypothetical protein
MNTGELPSAWVDDYRLFLKQCHRSLLASPDWSREAFLICHGVVLYLPLRYRTYSGFAGDKKNATANLVRDLRAETTLILCACSGMGYSEIDFEFFSNKAVRDPARRISHLVLGDETPVQADGSLRESFSEWQRMYVDTIAAFSELWTGQEIWPRWTCLSLHYASLCIELLIEKDVAMEAPLQPIRGVRNVVENLLRTPIKDGPRHLIERWLEWSRLSIDNTGLPQVGTPRRGAKPPSIRTVTEAAILRSAMKSIKTLSEFSQ